MQLCSMQILWTLRGLYWHLISFIMWRYYTSHMSFRLLWTRWLFYCRAVWHEFGVHVGRVWLCLALPAAGCSASSAAMLPSAWSGALVSAALACWWRKRYPPAVLLTAATALLSEFQYLITNSHLSHLLFYLCQDRLHAKKYPKNFTSYSEAISIQIISSSGL